MSPRPAWILALALCGCAPGAAPDHQTLVAQVTAAELAFARSMADRDHAAFLAFVAQDAVFLGGATPLRGRAAVGAGWQQYFTAAKAPFSWQPEQVDVIGSGTLALSTGPVRAPDGKVVAHYYSTWRLDPDGRWRVVLDNGYDACDCAKQQ